jgi:hypothetical protein
MIEHESHIRRQIARERAERIAAEYRRARRASPPPPRRRRARRRAGLAGVLGTLRRWSVDHAAASRP